MSSAPTHHFAAVLPGAGKPLAVVERPTPTPPADSILVRNHAIAANPADYKIQENTMHLKTPTVLGSDVCGTVVSVGANVTKFAPGDRVTGFAALIYSNDADEGAWQEYTLIRECAAAKVADSWSDEDAAALPMAVATAGLALVGKDLLSLDRVVSQTREKGVILVWGGASSVGAMAVQIARMWGYEVLATASKSNHEWVKKIGASEVFDYRQSDVVEQIVAAAKRAGERWIPRVFDAIGGEASLASCAKVVSETKGSGAVVGVNPWPQGSEKPEGVDIKFMFAANAFMDHIEVGTWLFNEWLPKVMADGSLVPSLPKVEVVEGGLSKTQDVFDQLKAGVSGKKLVVKPQ